MRSKSCLSSVLAPSLRRAKVEFNADKKVDYFPPNVRKLLPYVYYTQFKSWYNHFKIPINQRINKNIEWCENFKFDPWIKDSYASRDHSNMNDRAVQPSGTTRFNQNRGHPRNSSDSDRGGHNYDRRHNKSGRTSRCLRHRESRSRSPDRDRSPDLAEQISFDKCLS